jgi:hypothetical protein
MSGVMTVNKSIKDQIIFALADDNELMTAALNGDLDEENKQMNRELIQRHEEILAKLDRGEMLNQEDLVLVRDANEIHANDGLNLNGRHQEAMALEDWLDHMMELSMDEAMRILEEWLDRDPKTPVRAYRALHTLWEEATPNAAAPETAFDDKGRCLQCGSRVSFADATDTVVFAGEEIVKRHDGDITNRNCVRCTYPKQYPEYEGYDEGDAK